MQKFILNIILFCLFSIPFLELSTRYFMNYNAPFKERSNLNLNWNNVNQDDTILDRDNKGTIQPNQIVYHANNEKIFKDSIKYKINQYGQRGDNYRLKKEPNKTRIIFLGNSNLFDEHFYYSNGGDFTKLLAENLDTNYQIINASIPGATTNTFKEFITNDLLRFNPDILLISSIWNDIKVITENKQSLINLEKDKNKLTHNNPLLYPINRIDKLLSISVMYRKIRDYYWTKKLNLNKHNQYIEDFIEKDNNIIRNFNKELTQYKQRWIAMIDFLNNNNIMPIIINEERLINKNNTIDEKRQIKYFMVNVKSHLELVELFNKCDSILYNISKLKNVNIIDINDQIPKKLNYFIDHVHTTEEGSRLRADKYLKYLKQFIK